MKRILTATNPAEAHLIVEALRQEGIAASVQGEWGSIEGPSVWIENDADLDRADRLVAEIVPTQQPAHTVVQPHRRRVPVFLGGLSLGVLLGVAMAGVFTARYPNGTEGSPPESWDENGDGRVDSWGRYDGAGRLLEFSQDQNFDGVPDSWQTFDPPGVLSAARLDENFDGRADLWEVYKKGSRVSYTADLDHNGVVDEWGRFEQGIIVERNWSFSNDRVADKRAFYRAGRKVREEFDRNRDGVFEQTIQFDEFEREVSRR